MMNKSIFAAFVFAWGAAIPCLCCAVNDDNEAPDIQARRAWFREIYERLQPLSIYGKVVDQDGNPVEGAEVAVSWENASYLIGRPDFGRIDVVCSDTNGLWTFTITKPNRAFVGDVRKEGYALLQRHSYGSRGGDLVEMRPTPENPVISVLRKKGEEVFLLKTASFRLGILVEESDKTVGYDFVREVGGWDVMKPVLNDEPLVCDVQLRAVFKTNDATWTAVLSPGDTNGGILVTEELFYEAPETGYEEECVITFEAGGSADPTYLYVRSRNPPIYTRLRVDFVATERFFRIDGEAVTNPYGERNFEMATDLPYEVYAQLYREVQDAFRQNKRPPKPDLPRLVREAKKRKSERSDP